MRTKPVDVKILAGVLWEEDPEAHIMMRMLMWELRAGSGNSEGKRKLKQEKMQCIAA